MKSKVGVSNLLGDKNNQCLLTLYRRLTPFTVHTEDLNYTVKYFYIIYLLDSEGKQEYLIFTCAWHIQCLKPRT